MTTNKADVLVLLCGDVSDPYTSYDLTWYLDMWLMSEYDVIIQNKHVNNQERQAVQKLSTDDSSAAEMRCSVNFVPCLQTLLSLLVDTVSKQTDTPCHCLAPWSTVNQQNCYFVPQQHRLCICDSKSEMLVLRLSNLAAQKDIKVPFTSFLWNIDAEFNLLFTLHLT